MSEYFNQGQRQLQETFETVPLADRLQAGIITPEINPLDAEFIEAQNMFFLATVDDKGQANCSYKGGQKGLVKVVDPTTLAFPIYDGNGMFMSAGNVLVNGQVGLLFVDFNKQARVRVNGLASITENDPLLSNWPEAVLVVRVAVRETFPNCHDIFIKWRWLKNQLLCQKRSAQPQMPHGRNWKLWLMSCHLKTPIWRAMSKMCLLRSIEIRLL